VNETGKLCGNRENGLRVRLKREKDVGLHGFREHLGQRRRKVNASLAERALADACGLDLWANVDTLFASLVA
jgi:hypothetical protein